MRIQRQTNHLYRLGTLLSLFMMLCLTVFAQTKPAADEKGKKENSESAWKTQAQNISEEVGLSKDQTAKLTAAYLVVKKSHKQALKELPEEKDKDKARAATLAAIEKDRTKFAASLKGILTEELIAKVLPTLGSFNAKWDGLVAALQDLKLEKAAMKPAMKLVSNYVTEYETASIESMKTVNHRPNSKPFKAKLDAGLSEVLNAEQLKIWKDATASSDGKDKSNTSSETEKSSKSKKK